MRAVSAEWTRVGVKLIEEAEERREGRVRIVEVAREESHRAELNRLVWLKGNSLHVP